MLTAIILELMERGFVMKKSPVWRVLIAAVIYLVLFVLGSSSGAIHPSCYAYVGAVLPLAFGFVYLYTSANMKYFGAAAILNGFILIVGLIAGEGNVALIVGLLVLAALADLIRKFVGYDTKKGVRLSFIPFAFSFFSYTAHWWTNKADALAAAVEEMPAGYADKMERVIDNIPVLIIVLVLTVPVSILSMKLAEKALKKTAAKLK